MVSKLDGVIRLRKKIIGAITFSSLMVFFILFLFISETVKKDYSKFEYGRSRNKYLIVKNEFQGIFDVIKRIGTDWGMWDDTYNFVKNKNEDYIRSNLNEESIAALGIDSIYILDADGNPIYSTGYNYKYKKQVEPSKDLLRQLHKYDNTSGIHITDENKIFLFASSPITDSRGQKASIGKLIMAYEFKKETLKKMSHKLGIQLKFDEIVAEQEDVFDMIISKDKVHNKFYIPSVNGKNLVLKNELNADIFILGRESVRKYGLALLVNLIILVLIISYGMERLILSRLRKIENSVTEIIEKKDLSRRLEITGNDQISSLKYKINIFLHRIETMNKKLFEMATYDVMTGVFNRQTGLKKLETLIKRAKKEKKAVTGCFIDIDNLKVVNDKFSHSEGDELIKKIVFILKEILGEKSLLFRLGGDEFFMAFCEKELSEVERLFSRIKEIMHKYNESKEKPYSLEISWGIVQYEPHHSLDEFVELADKKMYTHKFTKK